MEREQIIKAWDCCCATGKDSCLECPYCRDKYFCDREQLKTDTLSLIKELTEDNEKLTVNMNAYGLTAKRLGEENESLEAEKEHLDLVVEGKLKRISALEKKVLELTDKNADWEAIAEQYQKQFEEAKADTVREFAEKLQNYYNRLSGKTFPPLVAYHIEQIAKEMLGVKDDASD